MQNSESLSPSLSCSLSQFHLFSLWNFMQTELYNKLIQHIFKQYYINYYYYISTHKYWHSLHLHPPQTVWPSSNGSVQRETTSLQLSSPKLPNPPPNEHSFCTKVKLPATALQQHSSSTNSRPLIVKEEQNLFSTKISFSSLYYVSGFIPWILLWSCIYFLFQGTFVKRLCCLP